MDPQGHLLRSKDEHILHLMQKVQPGFGSQNRLNLLKRFVASGAEQYRRCPHPGRQACPFQ